jgi:hypothetical protein
VGIVTADLVQHAVFSIGKRSYTPGVATSVLYLVYVVYFFVQEELRRLVGLDWAWVAVVGGAAFIGANYLAAWLKVRKGDCEPANP